MKQSLFNVPGFSSRDGLRWSGRQKSSLRDFSWSIKWTKHKWSWIFMFCFCFRVPDPSEVEKWKESFSHVMSSESKCKVNLSYLKIIIVIIDSAILCEIGVHIWAQQSFSWSSLLLPTVSQAFDSLFPWKIYFLNQNLFKIIALGVVSDNSLAHSSVIAAERALEIHILIVNLTKW